MPSVISNISCHLSLSLFVRKDEASGNVSLTLQPSVVLDGKGGVGGGLTWSSDRLTKGLKVKGRVAAVKDYGVFVQIDGSEVSHRCSWRVPLFVGGEGRGWCLLTLYCVMLSWLLLFVGDRGGVFGVMRSVSWMFCL